MISQSRETKTFDSTINGGVINFQAGGDYATNNS